MNVRKTLNVVGTAVAILLMIPLIGLIVGGSNRTQAPPTPMDKCFQQHQGWLSKMQSKELGWIDREVKAGEEAESLCRIELEKSPWGFEAKYGKAN